MRPNTKLYAIYGILLASAQAVVGCDVALTGGSGTLLVTKLSKPAPNVPLRLLDTLRQLTRRFPGSEPLSELNFGITRGKVVDDHSLSCILSLLTLAELGSRDTANPQDEKFLNLFRHAHALAERATSPERSEALARLTQDLAPEHALRVSALIDAALSALEWELQGSSLKWELLQSLSGLRDVESFAELLASLMGLQDAQVVAAGLVLSKDLSVMNPEQQHLVAALMLKSEPTATVLSELRSLGSQIANSPSGSKLIEDMQAALLRPFLAVTDIISLNPLREGPPPEPFSIEGTTSGLPSGQSLSLASGNGQVIAITSNGRFSFPEPGFLGGALQVLVTKQPQGTSVRWKGGLTFRFQSRCKISL